MHGSSHMWSSEIQISLINGKLKIKFYFEIKFKALETSSGFVTRVY